MAHSVHRLNALGVSRAKAGMHHDGGGLYLQVTASGAKSWIFRFMLRGVAREMGLGPAHAVTLAQARQKATECRRLRSDGIDPIEHRDAERDRTKVAKAKSVTFQECAAGYIAAHKAGWKNAKHAAQWETTLTGYAGPIFGSLPIETVDVGLVLKVLEPIWAKKPETASRLRGRIEAVLDWATARKYRTGDNPARWRGHLDNLLPKHTQVRKVKHHPALPYRDVGAFMSGLRKEQGAGARALEFLILTAARTSEVIGAQWPEVDWKAKTWTVPADRIKGGKEHRVPLSPRVIAVLQHCKGEDDTFVFPGGKPDRPLSNMALLTLLKRMERSDITAHGFRSTFRDWAAEQTNYPREAAEMALAHVVHDKVEAAYRRGDLFNKRRRLMDDWATYCDTASSKTAPEVVGLHPDRA